MRHVEGHAVAKAETMDDRSVRFGARIAALVGSMLLLIGAASLWFTAEKGQTGTSPGTLAIAENSTTAVLEQAADPDATVLTIPAPAAPKTREGKRLARIDRNDDGLVQQSEFLAQRRRNYDRLDKDGDGRLSFAEYAASGIEKFATADGDGNGILNPAEYAGTAPPPRKPTAVASRQCPPCTLAQAED